MRKALIFLAAGLSRRFGPENKLLHEVDGLPLYRHTLDKLERLQGENTRLVVVTNTPEIQLHCQARGISWTSSPEAERGIAHSLRAGLTAAGDAGAYVCFVADQPKLRAETIRRFLDACEASGAGLGCLACAEGWGNPVWFAAQFLPELMALTGDTGGKAVLRRHPDRVLAVAVEKWELEDVDLPLAIPGKID